MIPTDIGKFTKWLLKLSVDNKWMIVAEYSNPYLTSYIGTISKIVPAPASFRYQHYFAKDDSWILTTFSNPTITDHFIETIISQAHFLTLCTNTEMTFLIADDFHEECFSCNNSFYDKYLDFLKAEKLIK